MLSRESRALSYSSYDEDEGGGLKLPNPGVRAVLKKDSSGGYTLNLYICIESHLHDGGANAGAFM